MHLDVQVFQRKILEHGDPLSHITRSSLEFSLHQIIKIGLPLRRALRHSKVHQTRVSQYKSTKTTGRYMTKSQ